MAKVLFVVAGATYLVLKDGTGMPPGNGPRSSRCRARLRRDPASSG